MKRSILSVCMLALLCLLSCDMNALNDLLNEVREKVLDESKDNKDLNHKQENQEQKEVVIDLLEEEVEIQQDMEVKPVNAEFEVFRQVYSYYPQEEVIKIEEKDLVPSTEFEKEAQREIEKAESVFQDSEFAKLTGEQVLGLKNEYEQLKTSFYDIFSELNNKIQNKIERYFRRNKRQINRIQIQKLIQSYNQLNEERSNIDRLMIQVDSGLDELGSAKLFFNKAKVTLKEGITERLINKHRNYWRSRRGESDLVSRQARREAENALSQLESSSIKLIEAKVIKKEIEELIEQAKTVLENFAR
ncbi:P12 family lipoprotein [Borrelia venezuelensis]|uniref:P12 family lipoprotein n=1 Tax=Borrelia venezuelensis TaxID=1653839 RepID=UPI001FF50106|nr:P12 family lipoprotein [Borrelia venezuelensis]UPA12744.1 P12 family lipoprotein [Borrelia venezuelensis]